MTKRIRTFPLRHLVLITLLALFAEVLAAQDVAPRSIPSTHTTAVLTATQRLRTITDPVIRADARAAIATMRPIYQTFSVLARTYSSSDDFAKNQIESIIGQMDFIDEPQRVYSVAATMSEVDLFVATAFGLGNSQKALARRLTLALAETNQFKGTEAETARYAITDILVGTLRESDFAWLSDELARGALSKQQQAIAIRASERRPSPEAAAFLREVIQRAGDEEKVGLEKRLEAIQATIRRPPTQ
jgi:hypothetical protein